MLVEGPSRTDPALLRGRTRRNTTVNFAGTAEAGELVDVLDRGRDVDDAARARGVARRGLIPAQNAHSRHTPRHTVRFRRYARSGWWAGVPHEKSRTLGVAVIAIFGPTASGKTAVAEALASRLGTEVVSCDALQVYRGLPILTNQPARPTRLVGDP